MRNFLSILVLMLCQFYVANAQKCLVSFGVNEEVTEMPIENALYTLYLNDSIQVPYKVGCSKLALKARPKSAIIRSS